MSDYKKGDYPLFVDPKFYFGDNITVRGSASRDLIRINDNYNTVLAGAGNDLVTLVGANNALVYGEAGDDFIGTRSASTKNPTIYGGAGNDTIRTLSDRTYADGGDDDDLFIPLESVSRTTLIGGAGNDTFWFIESSTVTASGGTGNNLYQFDPYVIVPGKFSDPNYHNDVIITDISSRDTIRYDFEASDGTELSWYESNGNIILNDSMGFFTITLQGGASKKSEIAKVKYQAIDWSGTLGELFPDLVGDDPTPDPTSDTLTPSTLISNSTNNVKVNGTSYADSITNYGNYVTIDGGVGNDTIENNKANGVSVNGGAGNDSLVTYNGSNVTVLGGAGKDYIIANVWSNNWNYTIPNRNVIDGGADDDTIWGFMLNSSIYGGDGNDRISNLKSGYINGNLLFDTAGSSVYIDGGAGNDFIENYGNDVTIIGGTGNDTIKNSSTTGTLYRYRSGDGNDSISGISAKDTLRIENTGYSTSTSGNDLIITAGSGKITVQGGANVAFTILGTLTGGNDTLISNSRNNTVITGTSSADSIVNYGSTVTANGGAGNDTIENYASKVTINGDAGADNIYSSEDTSNIVIRAGEGNDSIYDYSSSYSTIYGGAGDDDMLDIRGTNKLIYGEAGNDWIGAVNYSTVFGGDGADTISIFGTNLTVDGGADNDSITGYYSFDGAKYVSIFGGAGNDTIIMLGGYNTINGGTGDDVITADTGYSFVNGNDGNDTIYIPGSNNIYNSNNTISGGSGNDYISLSSSAKNNVIKYTSGEGNDTVVGIKSGDTIQISGSSYTSAASGNDISLNVGTGSILLKNASGTAFSVIGTLQGGSGGDAVKFNAAKTSATITADYAEDTFDANDYSKLVTVNASKAEIDLNIIGNAKANVIIGSENDDIIEGGKGADKLTGGSGADTFVYTLGDGNDIINDYTEGEDKIQINGANVSTVINSASVKSGNVIFTVGSGKITVKGGDGQEILFVDEDGNEYTYPNDPDPEPVLLFNASSTSATVTAYYEDDTFDMTAYSKLVTLDATEAAVDLTIIGNAKANKIYGGDGNDCITGGTGADTLTGGGGDDTFVVIKGKGNKVIADYTEGEDRIEIQGADVSTVIKSASIKSGDVIFKVGTNNVTVKGGDGQEILFADEDGNEYTYPQEIDETVIFNAASTSATVTAYYEDDTFDANDYSKLVTIDATEAAIDLEILGNAKNNKIYGSENNDTLYGGKGTDTLTGNGGADTFRIVKGEGNKVIADYAEGEDVIYVEGADVSTVINSASVKSGNVIFTVGSGKITVKGGDGQEILFVDEDGNEYTYPPGIDEPPLLFNAASTSATVTAYYEDDTFDANDYSKLVTVNASEAEIDLNIIGNAKANVIIGSENDDIIEGGKGADKLTGGSGADTFVYTLGDGNDIINDYTEGEDKIQINGANVSTVINSASVKSGNVIFTVGSGKITVKGGDGQEILFVDEDGEEYTYPNEPDEETVIFNAASTSATVTAYYEDDTFDMTSYSKLVTLDATEAAVDLTIIGNAKANKIYGGDGNDCITGGTGADTLTGGGGDDIFVVIKGKGNKVIADYTEGEDRIEIQGAAVSTVINSATVKSGNVIFKVGTNNVTVKGGDGQEITFTDEDGEEYTYSKAVSGRSSMWFTEDDTNFISDTPQLDAISAPKYSVVTIPDAYSEIFAQNNQDAIIAASDK